MYYLALTLKTSTSGRAAPNNSGSGDEGRDDELVPAELAFPNLQPRLGLVKQVYEQLKPRLDAALGSAPHSRAAQPGAGPAGTAAPAAAGGEGKKRK